MLVVSYDISNTKVRTRFYKFLSKYGVRLQFSVFEIKNSVRVLNILKSEIEHTFSKQFTFADSVLIFSTQDETVIKYGHAIHRDKDFVVIE